MRKFLEKYWPILAFTAVILAFFSNLFFPTLSVYVTPDLGRSDLVHFNIPVRFAMANALKTFEVPFWAPNIGQGFPLFAESQIGFFYLPNLLLFGFFPFGLAYNLGYVISFLIAASGAYLLSRSLDLNKLASYLAAITYAFSPIFVLQIHHYNVIQSASITPWLFYLLNSFFQKKELKYLSILPIFIAQQILTGFYQFVLYSLAGLLIFLIYKLSSFSKTSVKIKILTYFTIFITIGFLISSIQLASTFELLHESRKESTITLNGLLTEFPFKGKNLFTVVNPYILGNPAEGTFPRLQRNKWSLFWETNTYFGIIQLVLITVFLIASLFKKIGFTKNKNVYFWTILGLIGVLLALGISSPLHPFFSIPPFYLFRVPSRFLILTFLSTSILAAYSVHYLSTLRKKLITLSICTLIFAATIDVFRVWHNYNLLGKQKDWLSTPEITEHIYKPGRIFTIGELLSWNDIFFIKGWSDQEENYRFFSNFLAQNYNLIFNKPQLHAYSGMNPKRIDLVARLTETSLLNSQKQGKSTTSQLTINDSVQKFLDLSFVRYIISASEIDSKNWKFQKRLAKDSVSIYLYENLNPLNQVFAVNDYVIAKTLPDIERILENNEFDPSEKVILEKPPSSYTKNSKASNNKVKIIDYQNTKVKIQADLESDSIIVISDSYYPGWKAYIDDVETEILAANVNSRAVIVPAGLHIIEYNFIPDNFYYWSILSFSSLILCLLSIIKFRKKILIS